MQSYLIEFRFNGYAKRYIKRIIYDVARKFRVGGVTSRRVVPHITLYGQFTTKKEKALVSIVSDVAKNYYLVPFTVKNFSYINKTPKVICLNISPSNELKKLRWELAKRLNKISDSCQPWDLGRDYVFHSTIAFKDIDKKFIRIWEYIKSKEEPNIKQHLLRITVLKGARILYEYDLMQWKMLNRSQALSRQGQKRTFNIFMSQKDEFRKEIDYKKSICERIGDFFSGGSW